VIKVYTPTTAPSYATTASSIVLGGTASDDRGLAQVAWSNSAGGSGVAFGTTGWSTPSVPLVVGVNVITVTVKDACRYVAMAAMTVIARPVAHGSHSCEARRPVPPTSA
jgi:hypothetical protein